MTSQDIVNLRLSNLQVTNTKFTKPEEIVSCLGAVQSQDFSAAKWALGLRLPDTMDQQIEEAFNQGKILRTHIMRPTWHFIAPQDIRWILDLTSPRLHTFNGYYYRRSGLSKEIFKKSNQVITKALQGGKALSKTKLNETLQKAKIPTQDLGLTFIMLQAEIESLICSGPRIGKQFSYMLLEERAPKARRLSRDEALAELTRRFFLSHGPATIADFSWWSGLTVADIKKGLEMNGKQLLKETVNDQVYWFSNSSLPPPNSKLSAHLLPFYDEYVVAYKNRSAIFDPKYAQKVNNRGGILNPTIVINGQVVGTWKRTLKKDLVVITLTPFWDLTKAEVEAIEKAVEKYGQFLGMKVKII